ncbi:SMC-Scp complex subunit ScpB [Fructilactobacillus vespulae]|uniref:SMC-Scp complex subunit ScpB n=1 Tax=Fructilactobacillus vespulae TaxID=1249630 RepID=UPI0039B6E1BD
MLINQIEALIYVSGNQGITLQELEKYTSASKAAIRENILKLQHNYETSALCILENGNYFQMATKENYDNLVGSYLKSDKSMLSQAALETLTIIAYKQPTTRIKVDEIRGINSSVSINKLLSLDLVKVNGKLDEVGTPNLYVTTDQFLRAFGLKSIKDLPEMDENNLNNQEEMFHRQLDLLGD